MFTADGLDRPLYELAVLAELKNALRSGDMWIPGSRQFKDFEDYLLPPERFAILRDTPALPSAIDADGESYVSALLAHLEHKLREVDRLAGDGELPDAEISGELLKVTPGRLMIGVLDLEVVLNKRPGGKRLAGILAKKNLSFPAAA